MAIEKTITPITPEDLETEIEVSVADEEFYGVDDPEIEYQEDGGAVVSLDGTPIDDGDDSLLPGVSFYDNIADYMDEQELKSLASRLIQEVTSDISSRKKWSRKIVEGIRLLGLTVEESRSEPFEGASAVSHPLLLEAIVRFQAQAIGEIFPPEGPVKYKIVGKKTDKKDAQGKRVADYMNYLMTEEMDDYRSETDKMLFSLAFCGDAYKKIYWDECFGQPAAQFVPAEDFVVDYNATSIKRATRATHIMRMAGGELTRLQSAGFYSDREISPSSRTYSDFQEIENELDKVVAAQDVGITIDDHHTLYEVQVDLDLDFDTEAREEILCPYIVTIERGSSEVLSIRRNWSEDDERQTKRCHFVKYEYVPAFGFYGLGLLHLVGGLTSSATGTLRRLMDAGTLSNLPGGLKTKGLRMNANEPIQPGHWKDVDVLSGAIKDNIYTLPYGEPSAVLFQLMKDQVDEGRRFASIGDLKMGSMSAAAPVGSILALFEREMKVMTSIQARLHNSFRKEVKILAQIIKDNTEEFYPYDMEGEEELKASDFDDRIDILPVTNPNSATMVQRVLKYEAATNLAMKEPALYDKATLHRKMLKSLDYDDVDEIIPDTSNLPNLEPVSENMAMLTGEPVKVHEEQDHEAHIMVHTALMQNPKAQALVGQSSAPMVIKAAFEQHILSHIGYQQRHRVEEEMGVQLPPPGEALPTDIENNLSKLMAQAMQRVNQDDQVEAREEKRKQEEEDPHLQIARREIASKEEDVKARAQLARDKLALEREKADFKSKMDQAKLLLGEKNKDEDQMINLVRILVEASANEMESASKESIESAKRGVETLTAFINSQKKEPKE